MAQKLKDPTEGMELNLKSEDDDAPGTGAGILSMLASVGGMIPSLLKGPQTRELQNIQRGGGAGAAIARRTASEAARRVAGNVRGTDLREGLRAADAIVQRGAQQASITGAREAAIATSQLRANEFARRGSFRKLGAGVGQGLAGIGAMLASAKDQGPTEEEQSGGGGGGGGGDEDLNPNWGNDMMTPDEVALAHQAAFIDDAGQQLQGFQQQRMQLQPPAPQGPELPPPVGGPGDPVFDQQQQNLSGISPALAQPSSAPSKGGQAGQAPGSADFMGPSGGGQGALASPIQQLEEATAKKTQAAAELAASVSTAGEAFAYDPQWGAIATQLTDRSLTEEQARGMLALMGAPPAVIDVMVLNAVNGQRHYNLQQAVKDNLLRQQVRDAGGFAGQGPNRK
jgi:hypothetical protein